MRARAYVALICGAALSLAFPRLDVAPVAWVALTPLIVMAARQSWSRGFMLGLVFGIGFFGALLYWIAIVGYVAWVILVVLQSVFVAVFGALWALSSRILGRWLRVVAPAALWVACEFARSKIPVGGFTWGELVQSQHNLTWMLAGAGLAGGWGISFLIVTCNGALAEAWATARGLMPSPKTVVATASVAIVALVLPLAARPAEATGHPLKVAIVQGNVPRPFPGTVLALEHAIVASHVKLTNSLAAQHPDLVVWPESSVGIDPRTDPQVSEEIEGAARAVDAPMIVGGDEDVDATHYKVVAWLLDRSGRLVDTYQKTHLVPFGEYVPGRRFLGWLPLLDQIPADAVPANDPKNFSVDGGLVAPVLSYEGDFGSLVRQRIGMGGRLLVVATNTSTWNSSSASAQHVAMSQVRAAENGVWVLHAALSGISAIVAPDGTVVGSTPLFTATTLVHAVRFADHVTFYARAGDWLPYACAVLAVAALIAGMAAARKRSPAGATPQDVAATGI
ncbi:MAG: apolipoprotein N-acyltransferase [Actinomycetota bacterium]|nr:apolipoprotein N-acyltransferase [Actinomycetota bacterium]